MNEDTQTQEAIATETTETTKAAKPKKSAKKSAKKSVKKSAKKSAKAKKSASMPYTGGGPAAVLSEYAKTYTRHADKKTAGGNVSVDNNDALATKLRGKSLADVYEAAAKVVTDKDGGSLSVNKLKSLYGHLNPGMQRMVLGNRMRAA